MVFARVVLSVAGTGFDLARVDALPVGLARTLKGFPRTVLDPDAVVPPTCGRIHMSLL